jgi:hypothetical protein
MKIYFQCQPLSKDVNKEYNKRFHISELRTRGKKNSIELSSYGRAKYCFIWGCHNVRREKNNSYFFGLRVVQR